MNQAKILKGIAWKWFERISVQLLNLVIDIILARLLFPEDYGIIAVLSVFIAITEVLVQNGFNSALIQKKDTDKDDYSTILVAGLAIALISYLILFFAAPYIADVYHNGLLSSVLRVLAISLFFLAVNSVFVAKLSRELNFKKIFIGNFFSSVISGMIAITFAHMGLGVWALVIQQLLYHIFCTLFLVLRVKMTFGRFSIVRLKPMFNFGWKIMLSTTIAVITENLYKVLIGTNYDTRTTGYYTKGDKFPSTICASINQTITGVIFPVLSSVQNEKEKLKAITRKSISASTFILFPLLVGLAVIAEPTVMILLTEKWLPCVPFLQIECAFYAIQSMSYPAGQAIRATGHSSVSLVLESIKTSLTLIMFMTLYRFVDLYYLVSMRAVIALIVVVIQSAFAKHYIGYSLKERISDVFPNVCIALIMGGLVYSISLLKVNAILQIAIQIIVGVASYVGLAAITKNPMFIEGTRLLKQKMVKSNWAM